jgi:hypothetical protein
MAGLKRFKEPEGFQNLQALVRNDTLYFISNK